MTSHPTDIEPDVPVNLAALLQEFGEHWTITRQPAVWEAVSRPVPSRIIVHVARSLSDLRVKLEAEEL